MKPIELNVISNCDDAVLFWRVDKPIPDCWGFAIEREQKTADGVVRSRLLDNRKGFAQDEPKPGDIRPSNIWPFQRFSWTDHSVDLGARVRYRIIPMVHENGQLQQASGQQSKWSAWLELSAATADGMSVFFNRGLVISQFMARYLEDLRVKNKLKTRRQALSVFKESLGEHELPIRVFLSGLLRTELLQLLADAKKKKWHVFGALYELNDDELIQALAALGSHGHLVLSNGSVDKKGQDENKLARELLKKKKLDVNDRMVAPSSLGHNKFLVFTDSKKKPLAVWTGSTNWTTTGLCTQLNNALYVRHGGLARLYLEQWQRLLAAGSTFPPALVQANNEPKQLKVGASPTTLWFTRTQGLVDLAALEKLVNGAKHAVLFLMFQPGGVGTLGAINKLVAKASSSKLYIKGVVSTLPSTTDPDPDHVQVATVGNEAKHRLSLDIVQPQGFTSPFASWAATVTRGEFIPPAGVVGHAIVHTKLIVIDPFTNPVVVTGSHNFSKSASNSNDENFVIVRDNPQLARAYASHILAVYDHYRWLAFVAETQRQGKKLNGFLHENDTWQKHMLTGPAARELDFWLG